LAEERLSLQYSGPAVDDGRMPVRDLAPALIALGELFQETNLITHPEMPPISLDIRAFDKGSFEVHLSLQHAEGIAGQLASLFSTGDASALREVIALVTSLLELLKGIKGRKEDKREKVQPGKTRLTLEDGTTIETDSSVVVLLDRPSARRHAHSVVSPLSREGIDHLEINPPEGAPLTIDKVDLVSFGEPAQLGTADLGTTELEISLTIISPSFDDNYKWRVSDGSAIYWVDIQDKDFMARVHRNEVVFGEGDILQCFVRIHQWVDASGLKAERTVTRVLSHRPTGRPLKLPYSEPADELQDEDDSDSPPLFLGEGEPPSRG
jgi:hypothetical protein